MLCEAKSSISILLGTPCMIYEIQANAKASLSVPGRKPSNTLFSLLCPCFSPEDPKIESLNGIFGVQNIMSLEDMGACSSNESIIAIRWKFSCLKIRFEKIISDWLSIDKSSQRGIFNNTLNDWSSLLGGSGNGYFVLRTDVFLRINDRCDVVLLLLNHGSLVTHIWHISISDAVAYSQKWKHFNTCSGLDLTTTNVSCLSSGSVEMEQVLLMINVLRKPMNCWRVVRLLHTA